MDTMRQKVIRYYEDMVSQAPQYTPTAMAELAPGVIAVVDQSGECDVCFDVHRWGFKDPQVWGPAESGSSQLRDAQMNILPGKGFSSDISDIASMAIAAKEHLSPKDDAVWHDTPQYFEF